MLDMNIHFTFLDHLTAVLTGDWEMEAFFSVLSSYIIVSADIVTMRTRGLSLRTL